MLDGCRLCGGLTAPTFKTCVLGKYDVTYHTCVACESLQTDTPFWLGEAYADSNLTLSDTGPALRCVNSQAVVWVAARIMGFPKAASVLDYGGGIGLLCRLLRDIGFQARVSDSYAQNMLAGSFDDDGSRPDILCSFEVAEHFSNPAADMKRLFDRQAPMMILGTETYRGQGSNWWYISPHSGQHIFFYSEKAMTFLSKKYGYHYTRVGSLHFFLRRPMTRLKGSLLWRALSPRGVKWLRAYVAYNLTNDFAARDSKNLGG